MKKRFLIPLFVSVLAFSPLGCAPKGSTEPEVKTVAVESISLSQTTATIETEQSLNLTVTFNPEDATNKKVTWKSSNPYYAEVNEYGRVKGMRAGSAVITATSDDGGHTATCNVTVTQAPEGPHNIDVQLPDAPTFDEPAIFIHYYRKDCNYADWNLWLWEKDSAGKAFQFNAKDDWGVIACYPLSTWGDPVNKSLGFIVRKGEWTMKDVDSDRFINFSEFEKDSNDIYHIYLRMGDANVYTDKTGTMHAKIKNASFINETSILIQGNMPILSYKIFADGTKIIEVPEDTREAIVQKLPNDGTVDFTKKYVVEAKLATSEEITQTINKSPLYGTEKFGELFNYSGTDLGAVYTQESTSFKVWSPFSDTIKLRIYNTGTPASLQGSDEYREFEMTKGEKGVFSKVINEDLEGKYYTYVVTNSDYTNKEIVDPYAKSTGINGLRGMVVDFSKTNPTGWEKVNFLPYDRKQLTIYETHVADVSNSPTWNGNEANRRLFKGMYEAGTTYEENGVTVKTGFDHIKELGVNAVQIVPFFDQANDETNMEFNWGYNPLNYNTIEGGYSSDPYDGYARIKEFKELIKAYNEAGIEIIMDVVYNHVAGAAGSNFDVLIPGYYYRLTTSGDYSNGSGCGNETASERYMMRKFIVESTSFWMKEYKLGGFRFDLMGLHDLETMEQVSTTLKTINSNATVFGEPWTGGESQLVSSLAANQSNRNKFVGYGAFNDVIRDALIKGGLNDATDLGWITRAQGKFEGDADSIEAGIKGAIGGGALTVLDPNKNVQYATCHDNYTLYDRFAATGQYTIGEDDAVMAKMNVLANSIIFTSQGTSFMLAGEEFLRTKEIHTDELNKVTEDTYTKVGEHYISHNSYNSPYRVNELDYSLKVKHLDMFESYQKLVALKKSFAGLHLDQENAQRIEVTKNTNGSALSYKINADGKEYYIIHVNGAGNTGTYDLTRYTLYWSTLHKLNKTLSSSTTVEPYETVIAYK